MINIASTRTKTTKYYFQAMGVAEALELLIQIRVFMEIIGLLRTRFNTEVAAESKVALKGIKCIIVGIAKR